jgi:uncharacterized protein (DUF2336 family)
MVLDRVFPWIAEAPTDRRIAAVGPLVRAWAAIGLDEDDRDTAEAVMTFIAHDPEPEVRRTLAEALADVAGAPRHVLAVLLDDLPEIVLPLALRSPDLIDGELADLVRWTDDDVRVAVAGRDGIGPVTASALAEVADRGAVVRLLANPTAVVPVAALEQTIDRFGDEPDLRETLMNRPDVPIALRHRVLEKLAEAIGRRVAATVDAGRAAEITGHARERATVALAANARPGEIDELVEHLRATGRLTTRLVLRAACLGDLGFVEAALARLTGLPRRRVAALIGDGRRASLFALHRRAGMPDRAFAAFAAAIEEQRALAAETGGFDGDADDRSRFSRRLVERVLTRLGDAATAGGDDLLVLLRRFATDAARDHMRFVMARRTVALLPAPEPVAEVEAAAAPIEGVADAAVPAAIAEAVPQEPVTAADGLFDHALPEDFPPEWLIDPSEGEDRPAAGLDRAA